MSPGWALVSPGWASLFPSAKLIHKSSSTSYHNPLLLQLKVTKKQGKSKNSFRFESMWLKEPKCEEVVTEAWNEGLVAANSHPLLSCLNSCKAKLEEWNWTEFGHVGKEIARLQKLLEVQPTNLEVIKHIRETRVELNC